MSSTPAVTRTTHSAEETIAIGHQLGELLSPGQTIALCGPLGSGKTTFTKGVAVGLGVADGREVKSPTFVLIKEYAGRVPIAHVDLYRLEQLADAERIGLDAYLDGRAVCLIEWAEKFPALLPPDHLRITFSHHTPTERRLVVTAHGAASHQLLAAFQRSMRTMKTAP